MHKFVTFTSILLLFLVLTPVQLLAKDVIEVGIGGNHQVCRGSVKSFPVTVQNMIGVDQLRLVLVYDTDVLGYVEFFAVHSALSGGSFAVNTIEDSCIISWSRSTPASIFNDTLVWLNFEGFNGSAALTWQASGSVFHTSAGNSEISFQNGSAEVNSAISVDLTQIDPTCASLCEANFQADGKGGVAPYTYLWNNKPGRFGNIETGLCSGNANVVSVIDSWGCRLDSNFVIIGLPGANVNLIIEGNEDTAIYLQNPVLTFRFEENFPTHVVETPVWFFGDGDSAVSFNPTHLYSRANTNTDGFYILKLIVKNENGCDTTIEVKLNIKEADLKIPGVITPNGDSFNEAFMILNQKKTGSGEEIKVTTEFQSMELLIFDRWGRKIYEDSNYQSDWSANGVPDGAYYYRLKTIGYYKTEVHKGSLMVLGSSNNY